MAIFQRSQLFSIRRGQAKCRIVGNCGELWKVRKVILGEIVVELWGIMGEYGEMWRKEKSFVV
jgi:hypothetical protein